ncbi:MAG: bifunctional metallophosphatase/5'-nucleotidase [Bacteroidales bacterium]|nr:bifunctional metallophosphatase/5'-nucleotidase [Bacteroidales bacterium]
MKKFFNILIISLLLISCNSRQDELVILSVNDMHSHIEMMPKLAYVVDSLRAIYPELMVLSAGDNRTGNAYNDKYPGEPNWPMINLMNTIGFEASALGNHEFDGNIDGIRFVLEKAKFPLICSNAFFTGYPDVQLPDYIEITKSINGHDIKIILLGTIETSNDGKPSAHIKNLQNMDFVDAEDMIDKYLDLRGSCDVFILLSHCGLADELRFAEKYPQFDMIMGGHSHDLYTKQMDDGVLYTQSKYYLKMATVTKLKIKNGKVVGKEAQVIDLNKVNKVDEEVQALVDGYYDEQEFKKVVGHAKSPFADKNALGAYMADAERYITKADIAMQNPGGVRFDNMHGGDITKADVFNLDPFNNSLVVCEMTGSQVEDFIVLASNKDHNSTHVSGITYTAEYAQSDDGESGFVSAKAYLGNGQRINPDKVYKVTVNSYMAQWAKDCCQSMEDTGINSNDAELLYLSDHQNVEYKDVNRYTIKIINE